MKDNGVTLRLGDLVQFTNSAGPCLPAKVVKINRTTVTLDFHGSITKRYKGQVHKELCNLCAGPHGSYPNGYRD